MNAKIKRKQARDLQVTDGLTVAVFPNPDHEFLMTTKEVALGYGVTEYAIRKNKNRLDVELTEGKHFVKGGTISNTLKNIQPHQIYWTKRGIVRLGFAMRSERAKLFRDWAEDLIINVEENRAAKRNHNRLTQDRIVDLLSEVVKVEDRELRLSLANKIMGGE